MQSFFLPYTIPVASIPIRHRDKVLLSGSCFTEHIGNRMLEGKMHILSNPQGILFNPLSIAAGLRAGIEGKVYTAGDLFHWNELWNSWDFHSRFSHTDQEAALFAMNTAVRQTTAFLQEAQWLIITFGSAYQYFTTTLSGSAGYGVANCHKAPGNWFEKKLLSAEVLENTWKELLKDLHHFNPNLQIIFTVSPVRHIRDGLTENNRSKARLLELAHRLTELHGQSQYFPAYELVIDVLRDYRFFEQDMAHPGSQAVQYVWERFTETFIGKEDNELLYKIREIATAMQHRPRFPDTAAAAAFRERFWHKTKSLKEQFPYLDLDQELRYFAAGTSSL